MAYKRNRRTNRKSNPKNEESILFRRLTKLFSGAIVNYKSQTPRRLRRRQMDKYAKKFKSLGGLEFKKLTHNPFEHLMLENVQNQNRAERYVDFDQMEYSPILSTALDIYADEMTTHSNLSPILRIESSNYEIKQILETLFYDVLNIELNLFGWCRTMCKYGDLFLYLDTCEDLGVKSFIPLPTKEVERLDGLDEDNINYVQYQWNAGGLTFENWQIAHFRIPGNDKYTPYGTSVLDPSRRIWRQLTMMEDYMMAYRVVRSSEKRVYKIDVSMIEPEDVEQYMQKVITSFKRHEVLDRDSGRIDLRYNPLAVEEDIFLPHRQGMENDITTLPAGQNVTQIDDIKYLRELLFTSVKIPAAYLIQAAEGGGDEKQSLSQKDIHFSRTIIRLQRSLISELYKTAMVHLYILGYKGDDILNFNLSLNNPSKLSQLQELEHLRTQLDIGSLAKDSFFSDQYIARNIFGLSEDEYMQNIHEKHTDMHIQKSLENAINEPNYPGALSDETPEESDLNMGGEDDLGNVEDMADAEDQMGAEAEEDEGPVGEEPLLAVPGAAPAARRETKPHLTTGAKGNVYTPVKHDKRTSSVPRRKTMNAQTGRSTHTNTRQNTFPGSRNWFLKEEKKEIFNNIEKSMKLVKDSIDKIDKEKRNGD